MNIYGDRGNIISLRQRCAWRGIELRVLPVDVGSTIDWAECDMAFFGGGQDSGQSLIADDFFQRQSEGLARAVEHGMVMLAICGGYQMLGHYFLTHTGEKLPGVGVLDVHTVGGKQRLIGNIVIESKLTQLGSTELPTANYQLPTDIRLVGFENHSGRTYHGPGVRSLGRVLVGHGDNGEDGVGGAVYRNTIGCYLHGSLLPKNPQLADHLIRTALQRRYGSSVSLAPLDNTLELQAQRVMVERLLA
ncbi:MAG: glutamine amidotransferase [Chloroflexaceae bacterium]|jgi:hypothetical protein|nr:glutamine amidotransferase [Chloroflexaceae bacterium]